MLDFNVFYKQYDIQSAVTKLSYYKLRGDRKNKKEIKSIIGTIRNINFLSNTELEVVWQILKS